MTGKQSSFFRIDDQVFYTMITVCIISLAVFAFRFATNKPCTGVSISYGSDSIYVNDIVHFKIDSGAGQHFSWTFGDGNELDNGTSTINYRYKEARKYTVKVIMDGSCTDIREVEVFDRKGSIDNLPVAGPRVVALQTASTGERVRFYDASPASTSWEWYFDNSTEVYGRKREVFYTFTKPGTHKVYLVVNKNPSLSFTDYISVNDRPAIEDPVNSPGITPQTTIPRTDIQDDPTPPRLVAPKDTGLINPPAASTAPPVITTPPVTKDTEIKKAPKFSNNQWAAALMDVSQRKKTAQDFSQYLCGNLNVTVFFKDKRERSSETYKFKEFCDFIVIKRGQKEIKSIVVKPTTSPDNNCVLNLMVNIERSPLGGW